MHLMRLSLGTILVAAVAGGMVVACKPSTPPETAAPAASTAPAAPNPTIAAEQAPQAPTPAKSVIATQPGMKDSQWDLTKAKVTGNLLTVQFTVRTSPEHNLFEDLPIDQINVIDDATAQRYSVVKDQSDQPMVSRANTANNKLLRIEAAPKGTAVVWLKFPAPPPASSTISISIPQVGAFDGVTIQR